MADDRFEPNRFLGFPVRTGPRAKRDEESQRFMGFPVDWFVGGERVQDAPLARPIRGYKRWLRRRRLGPDAVDEDQGH